MKTTVRALLDERRPLYDGTYPVKLRVINNRRNKVYGIDITLSQNDFKRLFTDSNLRNKRTKINDKIKKAEEIIGLLDDNFSFTEFEKRFYGSIQAVVKNNLNLIDQKLSRMPTTNFARHSFSTVLKRAGVPIEMISEQLGHSNIKTTQIYLDSFEKEQRKEIGKYLFEFNERK